MTDKCWCGKGLIELRRPGSEVFARVCPVCDTGTLYCGERALCGISGAAFYALSKEAADAKS